MSAPLPTGYKQTEVGVIPGDWEVREFADVATLERGKFSARPRNDPKYYGGTIPFIQTGDVTNSNGNIASFSQTLNEAGLKVSKLFPRDTLFFTIAANIGDVGFTAFNTACPDSLVAITPNPQLDKRWLYQELKSRKKVFEGLATQNAQLNINLEKLRPYLLPIPPLPEQRAIAAALSDVDALLAKLDAFIAKKRDLKQAAMQQLLTGQTRLPGFGGEANYKQTAVGLIPDDWEVAQLSSVARTPVQNGVFNEPARKGRGCKLINVGDLYSAAPIDIENLEKFDATKSEVSKFGVEHGDLFFTRSSITPDGIAHCNICDKTNQDEIVFDCHIIRVQANAKKVDPFFLAKFCITRPARTYLVANAKTTTMTTVDQAVIGSLPIPIPPLPEQTAIATILSDMDSELSALEARRDKTRALKQGMMQELLTGRIRLL